MIGVAYMKVAVDTWKLTRECIPNTHAHTYTRAHTNIHTEHTTKDNIVQIVECHLLFSPTFTVRYTQPMHSSLLKLIIVSVETHLCLCLNSSLSLLKLIFVSVETHLCLC